MTTPLDNFIDVIEQQKKQLDEVLEAYRQFRAKLDALPPEMVALAEKALAPNGAATPEAVATKTEEFAGKTALDCVRVILSERNNEPMHFATIARESIRRGYKGRTTGTAEEIEARTIQSFWAAMSRAEDMEAVGKGCYRLNE